MNQLLGLLLAMFISPVKKGKRGSIDPFDLCSSWPTNSTYEYGFLSLESICLLRDIRLLSSYEFLILVISFAPKSYFILLFL